MSKRIILIVTALLAACAGDEGAPQQEPALQASSTAGAPSTVAAAQSALCAGPTAPSYFPVRGSHETGYSDGNTGNSAFWSCGNARSNSDFWKGSNCDTGHYGLDIWASRGTPVVSTVRGVVAESRWSDYSGNVVTIQDDCGWWHFNIHLDSKVVSQGQSVAAGQLIGYVGNTGTASNGVVHLHYSVYPGSGNYCQGVNPQPLIAPVESDVCWVPEACGASVCGRNAFCNGQRCCPTDRCVSGCPC